MKKKTVRLDCFENDWYIPGQKIMVLLWYFVNVVFFINPLNPSSGIKIFLLKIFGARIGKGCVIKPGVNIKYPWNLVVGNNCWIGERVWIDNLGQVALGNHVCLSQGAYLLTGNHNYKKTTFDLIIGDISIEDGVWIGAKSVVCPGIICHSHAVLAVQSVANKDLEPYSIYAGNPATKTRNRTISL